MTIKKSKALELLEQHENRLLKIKKRLYYLKAYERELAKATKNKLFLIKNEVVHQTMTDSWHQLVTDFASLCKDMYDRGGFFNRLNSHLKELRQANEAEIEPPNGIINYVGSQPGELQREQDQKELDAHFVDLLLKGNEAAFYRLFPLAKERPKKKIEQTDVEHLKDMFQRIAEAVITDRHRNRAHRYERRMTKDKAPSLGLKELEEKFDEVERILNDIRIICSMSTFTYSDVNAANVDQTAADLVDLVLFGSSKQIHERMGINTDLQRGGGSYGWTYREKYYEKIHQEQDMKYAEICQAEAKKCREKRDYDSVRIPPVYFNALELYK